MPEDGHPKILEFRISPRPGNQTTVRVSSSITIPPGSFGVQYKATPTPTEILSILFATTGVSAIDLPENPNISSVEIRHREGPAGASLDCVFFLKDQGIRVLEMAQQGRDLVLVFGE